MSNNVCHPRFFDNPAFRRYVKQLYQLHQLYEQGADQTPEADALRDEMDLPCEDMTQDEIHAVNGISADLYTLSDPKKDPVNESPQRTSEVLKDVLDLKARGEFCVAFQRIRENDQFLDADRVAFMRGSIWRDLGEFEIASRFLEAATKEKFGMPAGG